MKKALIAIITLFLFSFCEKSYSIEKECSPVLSCTVSFDYTGFGIPNFQGNCYLVTKAQIRWMQQNGYLPNISLAPDSNTAATRSEVETYCGTGSPMSYSSSFTSLASNGCPAIGWFGQIV